MEKVIINEISKDIVLKLQTFTDKLNNRIAEEVENFKNLYNEMNIGIETIDTSTKLLFLAYKNDSVK